MLLSTRSSEQVIVHGKKKHFELLVTPKRAGFVAAVNVLILSIVSFVIPLYYAYESSKTEGSDANSSTTESEMATTSKSRSETERK